MLIFITKCVNGYAISSHFTCDHFSMLKLELIHVSKRAPGVTGLYSTRYNLLFYEIPLMRREYVVLVPLRLMTMAIDKGHI